jgi:hypothetical protein
MQERITETLYYLLHLTEVGCAGGQLCLQICCVVQGKTELSGLLLRRSRCDCVGFA